MTDFLKITKSIVVHFAHICAYGVETVKRQLIFHTTISMTRGQAWPNNLNLKMEQCLKSYRSPMLACHCSVIPWHNSSS